MAEVEVGVDDPLAQAIRETRPDTFIGAKVGDETYRLNRWEHRKGCDGWRIVTFWDSEKDLLNRWRIPWRFRIRIALDRLWWRATGWI